MAFERIRYFWLGWTILASIFALDTSYATATERPEWADPMSRFEAAMYAGRADEALAQLPTLQTAASTAPPREQLHVSRRVFDLCSLAFQGACATEAFRQFSQLHKELAAENSQSQNPRLLAGDAIERVTRTLLYGADKKTLGEALALLERATAAAADSWDFVRANLTLAQGYAELEHSEKSARYLRRAWLYFLSDRGMSAEEFVVHMPSFIALFRRTGQLERARAALFIADTAVGRFAHRHLYAGVPLLQARIGIYTDGGNLQAALHQVEVARVILARLTFPQWLKRHYDIALTTEHALLCGLHDVSQCRPDIMPRLKELFDARDAKDVPLTVEQKRALALSLAFHAVIRQTPLHPGVREALYKEDATPAVATPSEAEVASAAGRAFVAMAENAPDRKERAIAAAELEVQRTRARIVENPFEAISLPAYSLVVLQMGAGALAQSESLTEPQQSLLLTIADLLKQSPRSVESRYLHLLASMPNEEMAASLQALHRLEQRLFALEKEQLRSLVELAEGKSSDEGKFDGAAWLRFDELDRAILGHREAISLARAAAPGSLNQLAELKSSLNPDEVYVSPVGVFGRVLRICIDKARFSAVIEPYDAKRLLLAQKLVRSSLTNPVAGTATDAVFPVAEARYLSSVILGQDDLCLGKHRNVVFSLDASTISLPMGVLLDPAGPAVLAGSGLGAVPWLGLTRNIATVTDTAQLLSTRRLRGPSNLSRSFLGIGDPTLTSAIASGNDAVGNVLRGVRRNGINLDALDELPDTADELRSLASAFGPSSRVMLREKASELALRRLVLADYRVLSFATHGLVREEVEGLSEPALVLTPRNPHSAVDDGLLTASEIAQLDIRAEVVLLSACNSASFDLQLFGPQAAGLSSSFFLAGARSTVASLWSVDSQATGLLFREFASFFAPGELSVSAAMRRASLALVRSHPRYQHPKYWAAFVTFGDGLYRDAGQKLATQQLEEVALDDEDAKPGEVTGVLATGDDEVLVSAITPSESIRATSQLFLLRDKRVAWKVEDADYAFLIPSSSRKGIPPVVSWRYEDDEGTEVVLRRYDSSGESLSQRRVDFPHTQLVVSAAELENGNLVLAGLDFDDRREATLTLASANGDILKTLRLAVPGDAQLRLARVFPSGSGIVVSLFQEISRPNARPTLSALGALWPCDTSYRTELVFLSARLEREGRNQTFADIEVSSVVPHRMDQHAAAVTAFGKCRPYDTAVAGLLLLAPGNEPLLRLARVPGFTSEGRLGLLNRDELVLVGTVRRALSESQSDVSDWKTTKDLFSTERIQPGRTTGVLVSRFDSKGTLISSHTYFNGGMTLITTGAVAELEFWLGGSNNWTRYLAKVPRNSMQ